MRILLTGSSGMIGSAVAQALAAEGHDLIRLVRTPAPAESTAVLWNPDSREGLLDRRLENLDAVIHLAGEPVLGRWTPDKKSAIRTSRIQGTTQLVNALAELKQKPHTLLCASAIGYYGDTGETEVDETAPAGEGFLAQVCRDWEEVCEPARAAGIRTVNLRIGIVLDGSRGALKTMLPPFRLGLGGPIGNGQLYMSWISLRDIVRSIRFLLESTVQGPVNLVAPGPVTNRTFTRLLGRVLHRPAILPIPATALRLMFGEVADQTMLASVRVHPEALLQAGFAFTDTDLEETLQNLVGRPPGT